MIGLAGVSLALCLGCAGIVAEPGSRIGELPGAQLQEGPLRATTLIVKPTFVVQEFSTLASSRTLTKEDVNHLLVEIFETIGPETASLAASADVPAEKLDQLITFQNLAPHTTYIIRPRAYAVAGFMQESQISEDAASIREFSIEADDFEVVEIRVRLLDTLFEASASVRLQIKDGGLITPGRPGILVRRTTARGR